MKALDSSLLSGLDEAFEKYNEEQFTTVKLPGASQPVCLNLLESNGRRLMITR
jgi:capping protein alpha